MKIELQKEIGIVTFVSLFTVLAFLAVALLVREWSITMGILATLGLIIWVAMVATSFALARSKKYFASVLIIIPLVVVVVAGQLSIASMVGAILLALALLIAYRSIGEEINNRIKTKTIPVFKGGVKTILFGLLIAIIALYLPTIQNTFMDGGITLPERYIEFLLKPLAPALGGIIPDLSAESSIDDLIESQLKSQGMNAENIPPEQMELIRKQIEDQIGVPIEEGEQLSAVIAKKINSYLESLTGLGSTLLIIITIAFALLTLKMAIPFLIPPILGIIALIIFLSRLAGLVRIEEAETTIERLKI